ncbi:MAG TPA: hypothetical protein ENG63_05025 [Candidatus Desulfofervidus auxilii]|uniref:Uncharacterized protein n=1 Tax=Desulfofervidus auxilii TaxID=1621989 RepID=A0A7C0Y2R8_DESA2|nr:hypothetical protein [Candidatus Desulfofervidus auxilii]
MKDFDLISLCLELGFVIIKEENHYCVKKINQKDNSDQVVIRSNNLEDIKNFLEAQKTLVLSFSH